MIKLTSTGIAFGLMLLSYQVQSATFECRISYNAKEIVKEKRLFREVKYTKYHTGVVSGKGKTEKVCESSALAPLKKKKWIILKKSIDKMTPKI